MLYRNTFSIKKCIFKAIKFQARFVPLTFGS